MSLNIMKSFLIVQGGPKNILIIHLMSIFLITKIDFYWTKMSRVFQCNICGKQYHRKFDFRLHKKSNGCD